MLITLFSDASLCPHTRKGGWAGWLKSEGRTVRGGGAFKRPLNDTSIAEAMAVVNALHLGARRGLIATGATVLVQTDNDSIASVLQGTAKRRITATAAVVEDVARAFHTLVTGMEITIRWRHVKAHRGTVDRRSAVNDYCDEQAREHMRQARKGAPHWSQSPDCAVLPEDVGVETSTQIRKRRRRETAALMQPSEAGSVATPSARPTIQGLPPAMPIAPATAMRTQIILPKAPAPPAAAKNASRQKAVQPRQDAPASRPAAKPTAVRPGDAPLQRQHKNKAPVQGTEASKRRNRPSGRRRAAARRKRAAA